MPYRRGTFEPSPRVRWCLPALLFLWVGGTLHAWSVTAPAATLDAPVLTIDPSVLAFGEIEVGDSPTLSATLENVGDVAANTINFGGSALIAYTVDSADCDDGLAAGESCVIDVTFAPVQAGAMLAQVVVSGVEFATISLSLSGIGTLAGTPQIDVDPGSVEAVLQLGQQQSRTLNLANSGTAPLIWHIPEDYSKFDRQIDALVEWDDGGGPALYVGGTSLTGEFNGIARWDGETWSPVGIGLGPHGSRTVNDLIGHDGALIAAGTFLEAGGVRVNRIARWDGGQWSGLGLGMDGTINALAVYDGDLIAAGQFLQADGVAANRVARWDGESWSPLGAGVNGSVTALTVYDGMLIAGGAFLGAGGVSASRVAAWDGNQWSPLGGGIVDSLVQSLTVFDGELIVGGTFFDAGGVPVSRVARWNGSAWSALGDGITAGSRLAALTEFDGNLIAGGTLTEAGGIPVNNVAGWDGSDWFALGGGLVMASAGSARANALVEFQGGLFAGGRFTHAGGAPAEHIARWDGQAWAAQVADSPACRIPGWLSVSPREGTLAGSDIEPLEIRIDTRDLAPGDYETTVCVVSNDPSGEWVQVSVELTVTEPPVASITPDSFQFEMASGQTASDVLSIGNLGPVDLEWSLGAISPDIVIFDNINFTVPADGTGGSVRWDTGETCECDEPPFNFNMWRNFNANVLAFYWPSGGIPANAGGVADENQWYAVLRHGDVVGPGAGFIDFISTTEAGNWRQAGGVDGYLGFRFVNPATQVVNYGYARITTTGTSGHPATIVGWAYNQAGDPINIVPLSDEGCDDPADIPWLDVDPAGGVTMPDGNSAVDVSVDSSGLEVGEYDARLCVLTNDPSALLVEVPVTMTVDAPAPTPGDLQVSPAALSFGAVELGGSDNAEVTITHIAGPDAADLSLTSLDLTGDAAFLLVGGDCSESTALAPGASCIIEIGFAPATVGMATGTLSVETADGQLETVGLEGSGIEPEPPGDLIFDNRFEEEDG